MTNLDGSRWVFQYDTLGQVTGGAKYWSDGTPVAGQQFGYVFDTIGNRWSTTAGGDQTGANLRSASYTANHLNQYSSRTVPGGIDVIGSATNAATVTVNGQSTYRKNDYYWLQLAIANGGPVYQSVTNTAALSQGSYEVFSNTIGNVFVPPSTESFSYDPDGNLLTDGRWNYTWDAENRLSTMVARTAVGPQQSIKFEYDSQGRRIGKKVWSNTAFNGTPVVELKLLYDGWNLVGILNSSYALQTSFSWGSDLSGTIQGAGGIGGLLEINDVANGIHFVGYDGNGNVTALVKATDGTVSARYEYGPFGEVLRATGPMAKANPFRFSTKYQDDETDLLYYGHRYHCGSTGRWLSRDPSQEKGGINLYVFANNNAIIFFDARGLASVEITDAGGNTTYLREPTEAQVRAAIATFADGAIVDFSVAGHGNQEEMYFAKKTSGIFCNPLHDNRVEYDDNGSSFAESIRAKLAPRAHIHFRGCNTAGIRIWTGKKNISNQTAFELHGVYVSGSGTWRIGLYSPCGIYTGCQAGLTLPIVYYYPAP